MRPCMQQCGTSSEARLFSQGRPLKSPWEGFERVSGFCDLALCAEHSRRVQYSSVEYMTSVSREHARTLYIYTHMYACVVSLQPEVDAP